jgi:hypothetical protein
VQSNPKDDGNAASQTHPAVLNADGRAIAHQTLRYAASPQGFVDQFVGRLAALSKKSKGKLSSSKNAKSSAERIWSAMPLDCVAKL